MGPRTRFVLACIGTLAALGVLGAGVGYGLHLMFPGDPNTASFLGLIIGSAIGYIGALVAWAWYLEDMFEGGRRL